MTFTEIAKKVLEQSDKPMHYQDIWTKAVEMGFDKKLPEVKYGQRLTPWATLNAQLSVDIKYNPEDTIFVRTGRGVFYLKNKIKDLKAIKDNGEEQEDKKSNINENRLESELHKPLTKYLYSMRIYAKSINANAASNNKQGKMKWGTPDIVAVAFRDDIDKSVLNLCRTINIPTTEIYAYEIKRSIKMSNITEYFFQALSNSGWANEAYLVAEEIDDEDIDLIEEIKRLNQAFGVGVLHLNSQSPEESNIIFNARKKNALDLDTMHKLCANKEFKDFIEDVDDIASKEKDSRDKKINEKIRTNMLNDPN